jgi:hypothetical protein
MEIWTIPGPGEQIPEDERLGRLELYSEELVESTEPDEGDHLEGLGDDAEWADVDFRPTTTVDRFEPAAVERVAEGAVTVGNPRVGALPNLWYPDRDYYLVLLPFTLEEPTRYREYYRADFDLRFVTEGVTAFDMFPSNLDETSRVETEVTISPSLSFQGVSLAPGKVTFKIPFDFVEPVITAKGLGTESPRWTFRGRCAAVGNKAVGVVLQVPAGTAHVTGQVEWRATLDALITPRPRTGTFVVGLDLADSPTVPVRTS